MKKFNVVFKCLILMLFSLSGIVLSSCEFPGNNSQTSERVMTIETPAYLKLITTDESNLDYYERYDNLALITDNNVNATGYAFYVYCGNGDFTDLKLYVRYKTENNYLELKDVFEEEDQRISFSAQRYYFYVVALGGEVDGVKYNDSSNSTIIYVDFKIKLETPELSLDPRNMILAWKEIPGTTTYEIWEGVIANDFTTYKKIDTVQNQTTYDFSDYYYENIRNLNFIVKAIADKGTFYISSELSQSITYDSSVTLYNPKDLEYDGQTLVWEEIPGADYYTVVVDDTGKYTATTNSFDLHSVLAHNVGLHKVYVLSESYNENTVKDSQKYVIDVEIYEQLNLPYNIKVRQEDKNVIVTFDCDENAKTFTVYVNDKLLYSNLTEKSFAYSVENNYDIVNELIFTIKANGNGYYFDSEIASSDMFKFTQYLKTPVILGIERTSTNIFLMLELTMIDQVIYIYIDGYYVVVDDFRLTANNTALINMTDFLEGDDTFVISVESVSYNAYTVTSERSASFVYKYGVVVDSPVIESIRTSQDGSSIILKWNVVDGAKAYIVYVNDEPFTTVSVNTATIAKDMISPLEEGGYYFNVQAVGVDGCYDSVLKDNVYYKGYDGLDEVTGILIQPINNGFNINWDRVANAESYVLYIDNEAVELSDNSYTYITNKKIPYQIIIKAVASDDEDSSYSQKMMVNMSDMVVTGYTDKFVYFNGWHDYYIESIEELNIMLKYAFYNYSKLKVFIAESIVIDDSTITQLINGAMKDFGTNAVTITATFNKNAIDGVVGTVTEFDLQYSEGTSEPAQTSSTSAYNVYESQAYYTALSTNRTDDYNNFAPENSMIEVTVHNTNELYIAVEGGAKPIFAQNNYEAEKSYEIAKSILRKIISDDMTDYQKALSIYDYINYISVYDSFYLAGIKNDRRFWLNGPLLGRTGVSEGFAKLYSLMCNMEGIKTVTITGYKDVSETENHSWNKVYLDIDGNGEKEWFNVDLASDCGIYHKGKDDKIYELSTHEYFMLTDEELTNLYAYTDTVEANTHFNYYENYKLIHDGTEFDLCITSVAELETYIRYMRANYSIMNGKDVIINIQGKTAQEALNEANSTIGITINLVSKTYSQDSDFTLALIFMGEML